MTQEEMIRARQKLVHDMFSSTGEDFVNMVLKNCRSGVSALSQELRREMNTEEFEYEGSQWYKFRTGQPKGRTKRILYMHGGGFVMDSGIAQFQFAKYLADATGAEIWFPEYPIIPEENGKQALDMCMQLYREMLSGCPGEAIALGGDSAGGGLAVSVALQIIAEGLDAPSNLFLISPACNIGGVPRCEGEARFEAVCHERDPIVSTVAFPTALELWRGELDKNDWRINPMYGDLKSLPPMLIFCGGYEAMELGIRQFVEEAINQDADVVYYLKNRKGHAYVMFEPDSIEERNMIVNRLL